MSVIRNGYTECGRETFQTIFICPWSYLTVKVHEKILYEIQTNKKARLSSAITRLKP